jgi:hypothetical protein
MTKIMKKVRPPAGRTSCTVLGWLLCRIRSDGSVQISEQGFDAQRVFSGSVGDGVIWGNVATDTLQAVASKYSDGLGVALDDLLDHALGGNAGVNLPMYHVDLQSTHFNVVRG